jgi:hypothetical protein
MRDVVEALTAFRDRGACTDAERRAALWLHDDLRTRGYEAWVETKWVRPQWAWSLVWHGALGVALSLASTAVPEVGVGAVLLALSLGLEFLGVPVLARLFYRRATQVVVVEPPGPGISLYLVAHTDAPRGGLGSRLLPVVWLAVVALVGVAMLGAARTAGSEGTWVGAIQLVPTVVLLAFAAASLDSLLSSWPPGAADAGGVGVALALHEELTRQAPSRLSVGLLLCGAGEGWPHGFRAWRRSEKPSPEGTVIIELGPCGSGDVLWDTRQPQLAEAAAGRRVRARRPTTLSWRLPTLYVRTDGRTTVDQPGLDAVYEAVLDTIDRLDEALAESPAR